MLVLHLTVGMSDLQVPSKACNDNRWRPRDEALSLVDIESILIDDALHGFGYRPHAIDYGYVCDPITIPQDF